MTGVPQSSSHDGSSAVQQDASQRTFDVGSEGELLKLLNFIRRGPFLPDQKNMLRDVVLDFATTKDVEVLSVVETALSRNGASLTNGGKSLSGEPTSAPAPEPAARSIEESATEQANEPVPVPVSVPKPAGFGGARPQPAFGQTTTVPAPAPEPAAPAVDVSTKSVPVKSADPEPAPSVTEKAADVVPTATPLVDVPPAAPAMEPQQSETSAPAEPVVPPAAPEPEVAPEPAPAAPAADPLTRIKEIKMLVNKKVGNPVNLIDSNNQLGREYMNALLNAMKSINGGSHEDVVLAMQRLEKAYALVEESLSSGAIVIGKKEEPKEAVPEKTPETQSEEPAPQWGTSSVPKDAEFTTPAPEPVAQVPVTPAPTPAAEPVTPPVTPPAPEPVPVPVPPVPPTPAPQTQAAPPIPAAASVTPEPVTPAVTPPTPEPAQAIPTPAQPEAPAVPTPPPARSVAEQVQAEQAQRAELTHESAASIQAEKAAVANDPLHAEDVNRGMEQLLSEWKLFKSSGIFGTGPSGYDHPLFKAIAPLPMAAVIAGRFDNVTPEIRQSLSDYMSGWRYEQGVVHEMNESFEHYLRRVVHKILERQSGKAPQLPR